MENESSINVTTDTAFPKANFLDDDEKPHKTSKLTSRSGKAKGRALYVVNPYRPGILN